jgi:DNA-binding phage protein
MATAGEGDLIAAVQREARAYASRGGRLGELAARAGLSPQTVGRLVYGETIHPRLRTVLALLQAFGWDLRLEPPAGGKRPLPFPGASAPAGWHAIH